MSEISTCTKKEDMEGRGYGSKRMTRGKRGNLNASST